MKQRTFLLDRLWQLQLPKGYLSDADVYSLSKELGISYTELEGVISFYHFFRRSPAGEYSIYLNNSVVAEAKGFDEVWETLKKATVAQPGGTDPSGKFGLYKTSCIGLSDQEPAALINWQPFTQLTPEKVYHIINKLRKGTPVEELADEVPSNIQYMPPAKKRIFFRPYEMGKSLQKLKTMKPPAVINAIQESGLKGMGGAFFPTGLKWEYASKEPALPRYIVCNADEGEPGTFKDRVLMTEVPGLLLEGMIIAGYAIGANQGMIYLRAEYIWMKDKLEKEIQTFRDNGWLGEDVAGIKGFNYDISLHLGAGAYVCGEETALLESLEGKRGESRIKKYFPTQRGFLGKPTVINNVETLCAAARIIELGPQFFNQLGTPGSPGTKLLSVSGDVGKPGIYEIEWGMKLGKLMDLCQAEDPYFIQMSGPSGYMINPDNLHRKIAREDLPCGGSVMIFNHNRDLFGILENFAKFFQYESCGTCTPCRAGNFIMHRKLEKFHNGLAEEKDMQDIREWGEVMRMASRCGLGKTATNSVISAMEEFPHYFEERLFHDPDGLRKGFDLESAVSTYKKFKP